MVKPKSTVITAIVFDFETGGLDPQKCAATQISLHAVRLDTFEVMDKLNLYIYPYEYKGLEKTKPVRKVLKTKYEIQDEKEESGELMEYQQKALEISGITMEQLENNGVDLTEVCERIIDFIKRNTFNVTLNNKPFLVGQNPLFDIAFMQQIMTYTGLYDDFCKVLRCKKDFWGRPQPYYIDTIILAQLSFGGDQTVVSYKLEVSAERLGIDLDDAHDADADVTATQEIVRILTARMRNADGEGNYLDSLTPQKREKKRDHFKI